MIQTCAIRHLCLHAMDVAHIHTYIYIFAFVLGKIDYYQVNMLMPVIVAHQNTKLEFMYT